MFTFKLASLTLFLCSKIKRMFHLKCFCGFPRMRHRNEFTVRAWEKAVQELGKSFSSPEPPGPLNRQRLGTRAKVDRRLWGRECRQVCVEVAEVQTCWRHDCGKKHCSTNRTAPFKFPFSLNTDSMQGGSIVLLFVLLFSTNWAPYQRHKTMQTSRLH